MTYDEMKRTYNEKWLYLANCEFDSYWGLISGIPVIVADSAYDGVPEGVYGQFFNDPKYAPRGDITFKSEPMVFGFSAPQIEGMSLRETSN
jgi:hypothetical protein